MSEIFSVVSAIINLTNLLYQIKRSQTEKARKVVSEFEAELQNFANNVFGWYNQIARAIEFNTNLIKVETLEICLNGARQLGNVKLIMNKS